MSRTEISSVGIAKRYPPCAPRRLSMMFARLSSPKICSRNLSGMRWRRAISATPSGQSRSSSASSISARTAYLLFCVSLTKDHPTTENIPPGEIVAEIRKRQIPGRRRKRIPGICGVPSRLGFVDGPFHLPGVFLQLLLGPLGCLRDRAFDRRLPHHDQRGFAVVEQLPDLPHVRARHAPFEAADQGAGPGPMRPPRRMPGGKTRPSAAPTAAPYQPPCWVGFSILSTISTLPSSFLVTTAAS